MARIACDLVIAGAAELCTVPTAPAGAASANDEARLGMIRGGTLGCRGGRVVWRGTDEAAAEALAADGARVIDASGCTVLPGLIDAHTHLPNYGSRAAEFAMRLQGVPYLHILAGGGGILSTVKAVAGASDGQLLGAALADLDAMLLGGVTAVEAKSGYGLSTAAELRLLRLTGELGEQHPVDVIPTFLGAHAVPAEYKGNPDGFVELLLEEMLPAVKAQGRARICDVFCEPGAFSVSQSRRILYRARELGFGLKLHADEMSSSGGAELAAEVGALSADHLLFASEAGARAMAAAGTVGVLLPATVLSLLGDGLEVSHCRRQAAMLRASGVRLAVGSDYNPGTAPGRSLVLALSLACRIFGLTPAEAILGVTGHAAAALGWDGQRGSLEPGFPADIAIFEAATVGDIPYRLGDCAVRGVFRDGVALVDQGVLCWRKEVQTR